MATTTATLTLTSDINTDALALTTTHTLNKAGSSSTDYFTLELGASNIVIGRLYGQDIAWLPYEGEQDIDISSTGTSMELEFMVINEG